MVKMGEDSNGAAVIEAGTILNIKKGGILSVPYGDQRGSHKIPGWNRARAQRSGYEGARLRLGEIRQAADHAILPGRHKVYPSKIQVNAEKDQVVMSIVACDSCNNTNPTTFYKADVVFQFAKGGLAKMSAPQVEDAIGGLLAIDDSGGDQGGQQGNNQGGNGNGNDQGNESGGGGTSPASASTRTSAN